jgi:hypothetical protein
MTDDAGAGPRDEGFDDLLDAIDRGEGYYLECHEGHGSLPPRRICPHCSSRELTETPLPEVGEIRTHTTVSVAAPQFAEDAPYVTAIAAFGPVRLTGIVEADPAEIEVGTTVGVGIGESETRGERYVSFSPR